MISITPNKQWEAFASIYGDQSIIQRYYWFLFEFGKRSTVNFQKYLGMRISREIGDKEYRKRMVVAEMRDRGKFVWWAVVGSSKSLGAADLDPNKTIFHVQARFQIEDDPAREILDELGPWTVDTIPFIPSERAAVVIAKQVDPKKVEELRKRIKKRWDTIKSKLISFGIVFEDRMVVYQKLKVVRDLEIDATRYEFVLGKQHWRPSLRWLRTQGIKKMEKEKDLIRMWIDPKFSKYRVFRHYRLKLTQAELKQLQKFQDKVRQG